jgi:uncharacterized membrane protein SpoIIM required for sporulation
MTSATIVERTRAAGKDEDRFAALIDLADKGRLDFEGLRELGREYRVCTARLSEHKARARTRDPEALRYLNALCVRAYTHLYVPPRSKDLRFGFWLQDLPAALARTARLQLLATALLALGTLIGARLVLEDGQNAGAVVPESMYPAPALQHLYDSAQARRDFLERHDTAVSANGFFAGMLFTNNTRVGILSLATGILIAVPSTLLLIYNGLTLGGFAAIFMRGPERVEFLAWITPHAVPELLAIILCSTGGLAMGLAVIGPGRLGRRAALRAAGRDALQLGLVSVLLFVCAALIESFVRQSTLSTAVRMSVAGLAVCTLLGYVLLVRLLARRRPRVDVAFLNSAVPSTDS